MYFQQRQRNALKDQYTDMAEFLRKLDITVDIQEANEFTIPRISQLTKKTNQFNLTTRRYTEEDIKNFMKDGRHLVFSVNVKDKFGDNGLTGVFILDKKTRDSWEIDTLLLSCRIIGRDVEKAILAYIAQLAQKEKLKKLLGAFTPTEKNSLVKDFYPGNHFTKKGEGIFEIADFTLLKMPGHLTLLQPKSPATRATRA
ncbi:MAG: hypothetical protein V1743_06410 [Nanoarchaeota archaeon]